MALGVSAVATPPIGSVATGRSEATRRVGCRGCFPAPTNTPLRSSRAPARVSRRWSSSGRRSTLAVPATQRDERDGGDGQKDGGEWDKADLMSKIKSYGIAGTLSYVITELVFWAVALPAAAYSYHSTTGEWLSWSTDKAQLVGIAAGFVTVVRFAVPLRMGAALALTPSVDRLVVKRLLSAPNDDK